MATEEFTFEFLNKVETLGAALEGRMRALAQERLQKLQKGHQDLIGATIVHCTQVKGQQLAW